jgi:1,4-dihydroxy-2-naphthoate octaprenyltransferase
VAAVGIWLKEIRLPFLVLVPVSVLVGVSVAVWEGVDINASYLVLAFVGALLAHILSQSLGLGDTSYTSMVLPSFR